MHSSALRSVIKLPKQQSLCLTFANLVARIFQLRCLGPDSAPPNAGCLLTGNLGLLDDG